MSDAETPAPEGKSKFRLLSRLNIMLFLVAVVVGECLVAYLCMPSASDAGAATITPEQEAAAAEETEAEQAPYLPEEIPPEQVQEVDLGTYNVTAFDVESGIGWRVNFHLYGTVHEEDVEEFQMLFEKNRYRLRDQLLTIIRSSKETDFGDGNLGLIKRKVSAKVNELLGKPLLQEALFVDFLFYEQ